MRTDPKQNDAELCRLRGWKPGTILSVERETHDPLKTLDWRYMLTAVGHYSILVRRITYGELREEEKWSQRLRNAVIRKDEDQTLGSTKKPWEKSTQ